MNNLTALVTGGSRGIGEATAVALAERGFDVAITYREKKARADKVVERITGLGQRAIAFGGDMTDPSQRAVWLDDVDNWSGRLDALVLNASGGLETSILAKRPDYPVELNHSAQVGMVNNARHILAPGSTIAFITSHWAHLYGSVEQLPGYDPVAASKHMGELALRGMQDELAANDIRLLVLTGDLVEDTITAKLLERQQPGLAQARRDDFGQLINTVDMGLAIAEAVIDPGLSSGHTIVIGASLTSLRS